MYGPARPMDDKRVIVVGSGPPGSTAALFLANAGLNVTLLEAGSERSAFGLTVRVGGFTVAKWRRPLKLRRDGVSMAADQKAELYEDLSPGGLTNHWSCAVPRFSAEDFHDAERAGQEFAWPIAYDDLAPFYDRVEPLLHVAGDSLDTVHVPAGRVRRVWKLREDWTPIATEAKKQGRDVLAVPYVYGSDTGVTPSGTVFNSFVRLVKPLVRKKRVTVRYDAVVRRLEWSPKTRRIESVVYLDTHSGREERIPCAAVVLAAGAINTPKILLESTSDEFPEGLGNTDGVLGAYLHDHPVAKIVIDLGRPISMYPAAYISRAPLERTKPLYAAQSAQWTGIVLIAKSLMARSPGRLRWTGFSMFGTMAPVRANRVALDPAKETTKDGTSAIALSIRHPAESEEILNQTRDELLDVLGRAGFRPNLRIWKIENAGNANHYGGTCRMHASPRFGMLNAKNRLHAVPNVAVVDSSAFTTGPEKNPVLTAMALSARASDLLARDLRRGEL
jgi:choline dehydrogenase-like flavoprotein